MFTLCKTRLQHKLKPFKEGLPRQRESFIIGTELNFIEPWCVELLER